MTSPLDQAEAYLDSVGMLDLSGAVLYSGASTVTKGPVYILGLNPGGSEGATLRASLASSRDEHNAYLDEVWSPGGRPQPKGQSTLQRRMQHLCGMMGLQTRTVPISNLAFTRSTRTGAHQDFAGATRDCMPVHEIFIEAIRPQFLMTFGSLHNFSRVVPLANVSSRLADHGTWKAHRGVATIAGRQIEFGNVPHMSLWASDSREPVLRWALEKFQSGKATQ